jgi:DNA polymerase I-like protein with 3'-5' exonuclease and polymerase domains
MIYIITKQQELFDSENYQNISVEESLQLVKGFTNQWVQLDTETTGTDLHIDKCLSLQLGNIEETIQIVIDATTVDLRLYKKVIEESFIIGQNLKFDCQVLFAYGIIIRNCYDTMIVEQLLYLGYPNFMVGASEDIMRQYCQFTSGFPNWDDLDEKQKKAYLKNGVPEVADFIENHSGVGLKALCYRYLHENMSKEVRGEIIWRGLDTAVILYAANDVKPLYRIMKLQIERLKTLDMMKAAKTECDFVPVIAYYEWSGVHMNVPLWQQKMASDKKKMEEALAQLNQFVCKYGDSRFLYINTQGDLFSGWDLAPKCIINWNSPKQVIPFLTTLGFNCRGLDKKTKEEKDSLDASVLGPQRNINPEFYDIYLAYSEAKKVCSTYGQNYLNAINPKTDRVHTTFRALGTDTGRLACGSQKQNSSLAKFKGLPQGKTQDTELKCAYPQLQNLPSDEITRASFCAEKGNVWISVDYCGQESVLMADFSQDKAMLDVFLKGEDMHSTVAYMIYPNDIPRDMPIKDIKDFSKENHKKGGINYRQEAKGPEFCFAYAGNDSTLVQQYGMEPTVAKSIYDNYMAGFPGIATFQQKQKKFVVDNGYILISPVTGHKAFWWDWKWWKEVQASYTKEFWEDYRENHKGKKGDAIAKAVSKHFKAKTKWEKNACNSPLQGSGAVIFKRFNRALFDWVVDNGYFDIVKFCIPVHDEINVECPEDMAELVKNKIQEVMKAEAQPFLKTLTLNSDASISDHWIH